VDQLQRRRFPWESCAMEPELLSAVEKAKPPADSEHDAVDASTALPTPEPRENIEPIARRVAILGLLIVGGTVLVVEAFVSISQVWKSPRLADMMIDHLAATVALPIAGLGIAVLIAAFAVASRGKIELKVPGFELRGASGPVFLWIVGLLAYAVSLRMLW
jgi:hypothetical protein